jgi:prefoldin subunit 5
MKKVSIILFFLFISSFAYAGDSSDMKKIIYLEDQKKNLSAEYKKKQKELSEVTLKIHDIDSQLVELRAKPRQTHNPNY